MMCSICNESEIIDWGNNAEPINDGRCCNLCNEFFVIPSRVEELNVNSK